MISDHLLIGLIAMITLVGLSSFVGYRTMRYQVGNEIAKKKMRLLIPIVVVAVSVGVFLPDFPPSKNTGLLILDGFGFALFIFLFVRFYQQKSQSGDLLLDLGWMLKRHKYWAISWKILILSFAITVVGAFYTASEFDPGELLMVLTIVPGVCIVTFFKASKIQIRENGILTVGGLLRWKNIESFKWQGENSDVMTIRMKKGFWFAREGHLKVPSNQKEEVERILTEHLTTDAH